MTPILTHTVGVRHICKQKNIYIYIYIYISVNFGQRHCFTDDSVELNSLNSNNLVHDCLLNTVAFGGTKSNISVK